MTAIPVTLQGSWRDRALCLAEPALFDARDHAAVTIALHRCQRHCPVIAECLALATEDKLTGVIAGGVWWRTARNGDVVPRKDTPTVPAHLDQCRYCPPLTAGETR